MEMGQQPVAHCADQCRVHASDGYWADTRAHVDGVGHLPDPQPTISCLFSFDCSELWARCACT